MAYAQTTRRMAVNTPFGEDVLLLTRFGGHEEVSRLFRFNLEMLSEQEDLSFDSIIGKNVTVRLTTVTGEPRCFNGFVSRFSQGGRGPDFTTYYAEVVPWLWFLTRVSDCRIFQNKKVPDIIEQVFRLRGYHGFALRLHGQHPVREYCVQYRETDFAFVSRLMEEEGIFYFFEHENGHHTLVLADSASENKPIPDQEPLRVDATPSSAHEDDVITEWRFQEQVRPGKFSLTDYNFEMPNTSLAVNVTSRNHYELRDYPGEYNNRGLGDTLARLRLEEQEAPLAAVSGTSDCRRFVTGFNFKLTGYYREDQNQEYLLTSIRHAAYQGDDFRSGGHSAANYRNEFECIPASRPFRPQRITPVPIVQGSQTAVVVGPKGEEIFTDKYGRVKVQFHWDREGKRDENSSCWIRVSQPWAGKNWGTVSIPRIGQEVVVDFLEGDPDRPLITGRVYNAEQMPPYDLPAGAHMMGFKSRSTKGGGGYNEIVILDGKDGEMIRVYAQKDMQTTVLHDQKELVKNNKNIHVLQQLRTQVDQDATHKVKGNLVAHIEKNHAEIVTGERLIKAKKVIIEADEICFASGSNFVRISGAGVEIVGGQVEINCGGAPTPDSTSGLPCTPPNDPV